MRQLMKEFNKHKRRFRNDHRDMKMDLPPPLHNLNMGSRVVGGEITITKYVAAYSSFHYLLMSASDTMKSFFEPCVNDIVDLILGQVLQVEKQRTRLKV